MDDGVGLVVEEPASFVGNVRMGVFAKIRASKPILLYLNTWGGVDSAGWWCALANGATPPETISVVRCGKRAPARIVPAPS